MTEHEANEALKPKCPNLSMTPITPEQKEQAAKVLREVLWYLAIYFTASDTLEKLQTELAKVGLAIQPINEKETK